MGDAVARAHELQVLTGGAGVLSLAGGCLVRVSGSGHREALQRVLSQDVLAIAEGEGKLALLLAPKGQFQAIMAVFAAAGGTYILTPPGRAQEVAHRLSRYLMLSRCTAEAAGEAGALAVLGARYAEVAAAAGADGAALADGGWREAGEILWFGRTLLGVPGVVAVARDAPGMAALEARLSAAGATSLSEVAVQLARIRVGWPAWGAELTETVLPPEVGLEAEAISYSKGCYVGQETIARMQTYGHPNRGLVGLRQMAGGEAVPALPLPLSAAGEDKARGAVTSWARHPEIGGVGLALVRRQLMQPGTVLTGDGRTFEVAPFPLW
jgi:tRNA-modifying protein YgfZ